MPMAYARLLAVVPLLLFLAGCSALGVFDGIVPKDGGGQLAVKGLSYGPDPRQQLDVYRPAATAQNAGVVVFIYGGSWSSGNRDDYAFVADAFASRGFVTLLFDYRLVPAVRYPDFVQDSAKVVAWAYRNAERFGGDGDRLYVVGHSAGAYNAMMVALAPEFLKAEGLPVTAIRAAVGVSGPYDFLPLDDPATIEAFRGTDPLAETQPVNRPRPGRPTPPVLLLHGEADDYVFPRNSAALAKALKRAGHQVETKYYPGVDHKGTLLAIARPLRHTAPVLDDIARFLASN